MSDPLDDVFPCDFPIKVMGRRDGDLRAAADAIVARHFGALPEDKVSARASSDGRFVALTYTVRAQSRAQLDALYRELVACDAVLMAL